MNTFIKGILILGVIAIALTILERWFNIFFLGQLYANVGLGTALIGFAVPVVAIVGGIYFSIRIARF